MNNSAVFQRAAASQGGHLEPKVASAELYQQLRGLTLTRAALGTSFRLGAGARATYYVLTEVPDSGIEIRSSADILVKAPGMGPGDAKHAVVEPSAPDVSWLRESIGVHASQVKAILPGSIDSARAIHRLAGTIGVPTDPVVQACVSALRGQEWLTSWAKAHHGRSLRAIALLEDAVPLVILAGDPGTGKSVTLKSISGAAASLLGEPVVSVQLNERLRGVGIQGRAGSEVVGVFQSIGEFAEQSALPMVVTLDEAEAIAGLRVTSDAGSGEKENTAVLDGLVKGLDALASSSGKRVVLAFATNLLGRIDPAIIRRAQVFQFHRPDDTARLMIVRSALDDVFSENDLRCIAEAAQRAELPLTAADILGQIIQPAIQAAATASKPLALHDVLSLAESAIATRPVVPTQVA